MGTVRTLTGSLDGVNLLVIDGDARSEASLRAEALVDQALARGVSVLVTEAKPEHKRALMGNGRAPLSTGGRSHGYLLTSEHGPDGRKEIRVLNMPDRSVGLTWTHSELKDEGVGTSHVERREDASRFTRKEAHAFAEAVRQRLTEPTSTRDEVTPDFPNGAIVGHFQYTEASTAFQLDVSDNPAQTPTQWMDLDFWAIEDQGAADPAKYFHWLVAKASFGVNTGGMYWDSSTDRGYGLVRTKLYLTPDANHNGNLLLPFASSPTGMANGGTQAEASLSVGYLPPNASNPSFFTYAPSLPFLPLQDWTFRNYAPEAFNGYCFGWMQDDPVNGEDLDVDDGFYWSTSTADYHVHEFSSLASSGVTPSALAVWRSQSLIGADDDSQSLVQMNFHVDSLFLELWSGSTRRHNYTSSVYSGTQSLTLDFSALMQVGS